MGAHFQSLLRPGANQVGGNERPSAEPNAAGRVCAVCVGERKLRRRRVEWSPGVTDAQHPRGRGMTPRASWLKVSCTDVRIVVSLLRSEYGLDARGCREEAGLCDWTVLL